MTASPAESVARWNRLAPWLLVVVGVLVYVNTLPNDFIFDDTAHIEHNAQIRSLANLPQMIVGNPRWVPEVTLALNWAIDGDQPRGYHLFNMAIHILAAVTLWALLARTMRNAECGTRNSERGSTFRLPHAASPIRHCLVAFIIALLWLVHPLNTQAVTYVIQRHESLMGLFYLLTLYATVRTAQAQEKGRPTGRWIAAAVAACALGMSTKQVMATAPVVALLLDRAFLAGSFAQALRRRRWLYIGLAATWLMLPINGALSGIADEDSSAGFALKTVNWWQYLLSQGEVILHYLRLVFWPWPLVLDYQWLSAWLVVERYPDRWLIEIILPCAAVAALLGVSVYGLIRNTWWGFVGFSFFAVLSVTSSIIPIADLAMEHRMYLPLASVIALLVIAGDKAIDRWGDPRWRIAAGGLVGIAAVILAGLTVQRNFEYRTGVSIWTTVTQRAPLNPRGFHNLGEALGDAGRTDEAMAMYEQVLRMVPTFADAHHNMGNIYMDRGQPAQALRKFAAAVESAPRNADSRYGLATALYALGRFDEAREAIDAAIAIDPDSAKMYSLRGVLRARLGDAAGGITDLQRAIQLDPTYLEARYNLGMTLRDMGDHARAAKAFEAAMALAPRDPRAAAALARLLATSPDASVRDGRRAIELASGVRAMVGRRDVVILDTLAAAHAEVGDFERAALIVQRAMELARRQGLPAPIIEQLQSRLTLYQRGEAYREP